jgi:hypothetical protein
MRHEVDDVANCDGEVEVECRQPFRMATASGKLGWDERRGIRHIDGLRRAVPPQLLKDVSLKFQVLRHTFDDKSSLRDGGQVGAWLDPPQRLAGTVRTEETFSGKVLREPF